MLAQPLQLQSDSQRPAPTHRPAVMLALFALAALGFVAREVLAWVSFGSADVGIMTYLAHAIGAEGLFSLYQRDAGFNHTPLVPYWCWMVENVAHATGLPFAFVLKQPLIAADAVVCVALYRIWNRRAGELKAAAVAAAFAWCPVSILLSAHHGNFDPIYAALVLIAVDLIDARRAWFAAALVLGAAINVKLIPVILIPVLAMLCRDRREIGRFAGGLAVMVIPFLPAILGVPDAFVRNVVGYQSTVDKWGINLFLWEASREPRFAAVAQSLMLEFHDSGRYLLLAAIAIVALRARRGAWTATQAAAVTASMFMIVTPGFGLQYFAFVTPLLFATGLTHAIVFGIAAGLMALFNYWLNWPGGIPIDSTGIATTPRAPGPQFGLLAWATLATFVVGGRRSDPASDLRPLPSEL